MAQRRNLEEHLPSYLPKKQDLQMHEAIKSQQTTQCKMPPIVHLLTLLYYLVTAESSFSELLCRPWMLLDFSSYHWTFLDLFVAAGPSKGADSDAGVTTSQEFLSNASTLTFDKNSDVPPEDADAAAGALRPRCRGAFLLAHFLCSLPILLSFCSL